MSYFSQNIFDYLTKIYGDKFSKFYQELVQQEPAKYIRVNELKISPGKLISLLKSKYEINCLQPSGFQNILRVEDTNNLIGKTLEHILGFYYIQSFSSYIPPIILNPSKDNVVLDLCAAPGSKTTELGELMDNKGTLITNEIQMDRLKSLVYNIDRMNQMNAGVLHFKGEQLNTIYSEYFDKILVDSPCSGLGIIQKKNEVNDWWTLERVKRLSELQLKLLVSAIKMLKVGGEIIYSTCTLTVEENEMVIDKILEKYPVEIKDFNVDVPYHQGITFYEGRKLNSSLERAKRILPWEINSDGFFIIKLIKTGVTQAPHKRELRVPDIRLLDSFDKKINSYLKNLQDDFGIAEEVFSDYKFLLKSNDMHFVNNKWSDPNPGLFSRIGSRFGTINKDGKITLHTQAAQVLSDKISRGIYEIKNPNELKTYLSGGIIKDISSKTEQYTVKYEDYILGTAVFTKAGLKSQFPRSRRTQQIDSEI